MAKPKTKLPKVWVYMRHGMVMCASTKHAKPLPDETAHQYAPLQPPRKCVWVENGPNSGMPGTFDGSCGVCWYIDLSIASKKEHFSGLRFCPKCGGRITRRSPR